MYNITVEIGCITSVNADSSGLLPHAINVFGDYEFTQDSNTPNLAYMSASSCTLGFMHIDVMFISEI